MTGLKRQITSMIEQNNRIDGRARDNVRETEIINLNLEKWTASRELRRGNSVVLVFISLSNKRPYDNTPDQGGLIVDIKSNVENMDTINKVIGNNLNILELVRVTDRNIREAQAVDLSKLILPSGDAVFIEIKGVVLANDGGLLSMMTMGIAECLKNLVGDDELTETVRNAIRIENLPILSETFFKVNEYICIDPNNIEEYVSDSAISFCVNGLGRICSIQKMGIGEWSPQELIEISRQIIYMNNYKISGDGETN